MYADVGIRVREDDLARWREAARELGADNPPGGSPCWFIPEPGMRRAIGTSLDRYFPHPRRLVTAVTLLPSQQIVGHVDAPLPAGLARYHVPLPGASEAWSFHDGVWQQLRCGVVYRMDPLLPHGAVNWGSTPRVHLMVDCTPIGARED